MSGRSKSPLENNRYAYLEDGFDPRQLKVVELRDILTEHDVDMPSAARKGQLVDLFLEQVAPRRVELLEQYVNIVPSADRIVDASPRDGAGASSESGEPVARATRRKSPSRSPTRARSPRRVTSRGASNETDSIQEDVPESPVSPRRRGRRAAAAVAESQLLGTVPNLQPVSVDPMQAHEVATSVPSSPSAPLSPRRRRITKRVEMPTEQDRDSRMEVDNFADVNVRSPRSASKRTVSGKSTDSESSFTSDNVFQTGSKRSSRLLDADSGPSDEPSPKIRASHPTKLHLPRVQTPDVGDVPAKPRPRFQPQPQPQQQPHSAPSSKPEPQSRESSEPVERPPHVVDTPFGPEPVDPGPLVVTAESHVQHLPNVSQASPNRRGFMPSLNELRVSREFARKVEPVLEPSPLPQSEPHPEPHPEPQQPEPRQEPQPQPVPEPKSFSGPVSTTASSKQSHTSGLQARPDVNDEEELTDHADLEEDTGSNDEAQSTDQMANTLEQESPVQSNTVRVGAKSPQYTPQRHTSASTNVISWVSEAANKLLRPFITLNRIPFGCIALQILRIVGILVLFSVLAVATVSIKWYRDTAATAEYCEVGLSGSGRVYPSWTTANLVKSYPQLEIVAPAVSRGQQLVRTAMDTAWPDCRPCPDHASCFPEQLVICDTGYQLQQNVLAPLWPVAPRCVPDYERRRKLEVLSERAVQVLHDKRAEAACHIPPLDEKEAAMDEWALRAELHAAKAPQLSEAEFDVLWEQVVNTLGDHGDVQVVRQASSTTSQPLSASFGADQSLTQISIPPGLSHGYGSPTGASSDGPAAPRQTQRLPTVFVSRSLAHAPLSCRLRLHVVAWAAEHQGQLARAIAAVVGLSSFVLGVLVALRRRNRRRKLVATLVERVKRQAAAADLDRTGRTDRYVGVASLVRELVPSRDRRTIQDAVEHQRGVRTRVIEIWGEITRVWEWVG